MTDPATMGWLQLVDEAAALRKRLPKATGLARRGITARLDEVGAEIRKRMDRAA